MRITVLLLVIVLAGCAGRSTLEELEDEALVSGDWQAVEHREEMMKKRRGESAPSCPRGQTKFCIENGSGIDCMCAMPTGSR